MSKQRSLMLSLAVMLLWGSLYPVVKLGFQAYALETTGDILLFAGVRFAISGIMICLFTLFRNKQSFTRLKSTWMPVLMTGVFAIVLHYGFNYLGLLLTESSKTAILKQIGTLLYVCFSALFFRDDRLTVRKFIGVVLGFTGIIAINTGAGGISFGLGDVFIICASFCTVFANVISKKMFASIEPITATGVFQLFGGVLLWMIGKAMGGQMQVTLDTSLWILVYLCVAGSVAYCLWYTILKNGELSKLFIIKFAEPVFASLCGAALLGENIFRIQYLIAFLLIAGGIMISQTGKVK